MRSYHTQRTKGLRRFPKVNEAPIREQFFSAKWVPPGSIECHLNRPKMNWMVQILNKLFPGPSIAEMDSCNEALRVPRQTPTDTRSALENFSLLIPGRSHTLPNLGLDIIKEQKQS